MSAVVNSILPAVSTCADPSSSPPSLSPATFKGGGLVASASGLTDAGKSGSLGIANFGMQDPDNIYGVFLPGIDNNVRDCRQKHFACIFYLSAFPYRREAIYLLDGFLDLPGDLVCGGGIVLGYIVQDGF